MNILEREIPITIFSGTLKALFPCFLLFFVLHFGACRHDGTDSFNRLEKLRVLAIKSEPASPGPGDKAVFTPFVYLPDDADPPEYDWSWCPFSAGARDGYACLIEEDVLAERMSATGVGFPAYDLGKAQSATFDYSFAPVLQALCSGLVKLDQPLDCTDGFPILIKVVVSSGSEKVTSVRNVVLRLSADLPGNLNPQINGIKALIDEKEYPIGATAQTEVFREERNEIRADVSADQAETFKKEVKEGSPVEERERLILTWFVEGGRLKSERTSFIDGKVSLDILTKNFFTPDNPKEYEKENATIVLIIRDSRGGVGWLSGAVKLGGKR